MAPPAMRLRDRQGIATPWLYLILAIALLPCALIATRVLDQAAAGPAALIAIGQWLNTHLNLQWVSFEDRDVVLYILTLPLAALLIALTRLTLGIRVLGFRSILIAIGMQEIGVLPCLLLILLIAGTVVLVRPSMRRSGMPLFARVAIVLCLVAFTMLAGLLSGSWLQSATLWSMAFFPVVILAMLAESVADTVARDGLAMAVWRTVTTIALAAVIAGLQQLTPLRELVLSCPELLLAPLALIVLVSEFLDLRLFEGSSPFSKTRQTSPRVEIAVVRNRFPGASPRRLAAPAPDSYRKASLQKLIDQLRARDHVVHVLECDSSLPGRLRALANDAYGPNGHGLFVLDYSGGLQGKNRRLQVPAICEMLGIPRSGPDADAPALASDRRVHREALKAAGLRVPETVAPDKALRLIEDSTQELTLWPRFEADGSPTRVKGLRRFETNWRRIGQRSGELLVERSASGQAVTAVLLNPERADATQVLPLLRRTSGRQPFADAATLTDAQQDRIIDAATHAARAMRCIGLARIDLHCSARGDVIISQVHASEAPSARSATAVAAGLCGLSLADIAEHLVHSGLERLQKDEATPGAPALDFTTQAETQHSQTREIHPCPTSA